MKIKEKKGFTLVETLVVATIIALLASIGITSYSSLSRQARDNKRRADLENLRSALEQYRGNEPSANGLYPTQIPILLSGTPYINQVPTDPKSDYAYVYCYLSSGSNYEMCAALETVSGSKSCCSSTACGTGTCSYKINPLGVQ